MSDPGEFRRAPSTGSTEPRLDLGQINALVSTIHDHNLAWRSWFSAQEADPLVVTYEDLIADPGHAVLRILRFVGVAASPGWRPASPHRRQADELNAEWVRRYHAAYG